MIREQLMRRRMGRQAGFTLIELMIVIAIIGILAAVAIPNFLRARDRAQFSQCLESLTGLKVAEEMYITDHGTYTDEHDRLALYMVAGCTDPEGQDATCQNKVKDMIDRNCLSELDNPPGVWTLELVDDFTYQIKGISKDRTQCHICVTPSGYWPDNYVKQCVTGEAKDYQCP